MPYERRYINDRRPFRLEKLEARDAIHVTCLDCGHKAVVAPHVFLARFRPIVNLGVIKMRCTACESGNTRFEIFAARAPRSARDY